MWLSGEADVQPQRYEGSTVGAPSYIHRVTAKQMSLHTDTFSKMPCANSCTSRRCLGEPWWPASGARHGLTQRCPHPAGCRGAARGPSPAAGPEGLTKWWPHPAPRAPRRSQAPALTGGRRGRGAASRRASCPLATAGQRPSARLRPSEGPKAEGPR